MDILPMLIGSKKETEQQAAHFAPLLMAAIAMHAVGRMFGKGQRCCSGERCVEHKMVTFRVQRLVWALAPELRTLHSWTNLISSPSSNLCWKMRICFSIIAAELLQEIPTTYVSTLTNSVEEGGEGRVGAEKCPSRTPFSWEQKIQQCN